MESKTHVVRLTSYTPIHVLFAVINIWNLIRTTKVFVGWYENIRITLSMVAYPHLVLPLRNFAAPKKARA